MMKRKFTRLICLVLATLILVGGGSIATGAATASNSMSAITDKTIGDYIDALNMMSYEEYMAEYSEYFNNYREINKDLTPLVFDACSNWTYENTRGEQVYVITMVNGQWTLTVYDVIDRISPTTGKPELLRVPTGETYTSVTDAVEQGGFVKVDLPYVAEYDGRDALYLPEIGTMTWDIPFDAAGLYNVSFSYYPVYDPDFSKSASVERKFFVNGEPAFTESHALTFPKIWSSFKADKTSPLTATYKLTEDDSMSKVIADAEKAGLDYTVASDRKSITVVRPNVITQEIYEFVEKYEMRFFIIDANDNELRPTMVQTPEWAEFAIRDSGGFYSSDFGFVLTPDKDGKISFSLEGSNELLAVSSINLKPYERIQNYEEYLAALRNDGVDTKKDGSDKIKLEAENTIHTSTNGVYPIEDRTSALTSPCDTSRVLLNTIGTEKWSTAGQWVEYQFSTKSSGMYEIYSRYKQSYLDGMFVSRAMRIYTDCDTLEQYVAKYGTAAGYYNGVPFEEAAQLRYDYGTNWQVTNLSNGDGTYKIYFREGVTYTIRLEVTLGSMSPRVQQIQTILDTLNQAYLNIIKLTGTSPDDYRDYGFTRLLPDTLMQMLDMAKELDDLSAFLKSSAGVSSTYSGTCDRLSNLIRKMVFDENELAKNLDNFKSYVGNLGTFLTDAKTQPLQLDYLLIQPASAEVPKAEAGFFQSLWHEFNSFLQSFFRDYNSMGAMEDNVSNKSIDVWLAYGRDQSQVIRNLSTNKFTPDTGIAVNLKLVSGGTLLPSILAGMGPDVYLGLADETVINYAIRGAITNIEEKEGFNELVDACFNNAAMIQLEIADADGDMHTYGLPETQAFQMMFVRLDILGDLQIDIPKTWEDIYTAQSILESNNMEIGLNTNYKIFLYQSNGDLYADQGMRINLDSVKGLAAFEKMCNLFTQHSFPYKYEAANRFRTGEYPIILSDYTALYNKLKVFATEIDGKWAFYPVPGTVQEDGTINNTADSTIAAVVMIAGIEDEDSAWEFMKWYVGAECQTEYANEMVAIIGDSAKHNTANRLALESMPWTRSEYSEVSKQFENLAAIPNYPGSYYIGRHTNFAFLSAYNDDADPTTEILSYINTINKEITRKREEFNLETLEIGQTLASKRMNQAMTAIDELTEKYANTKYEAAIEAAKFAVANQKIAQLEEAAAMFEAIRDESWDGQKINVTKVNGKVVEKPSYYVNVTKQTAEEKDGGYRIDSLNEMQLIYFIGECLRNAATALASY